MIQQLNAADPALKLDQEQTLRKWTAPIRLQESEHLLQEKKISEAVAAFNQVYKMDSQLISADSWNILCRQGALRDHPAQVLDACEKAVHAATAEQSWEIRDSRGLARALTGNRQGAIEDFEVYIAKANNEKLKKQRQDWVYALRVSKNPFTKEELATLQNQ